MKKAATAAAQAQVKLSPDIIKEKLARFEKIQKKLAGNKNLYSEIDQLTHDLKDEDLSPFGYEVKDNFAEQNVAYKPAAVRRFEIVQPKVKKLKKAEKV